MRELEDKVAVITGAGSGMGRASAEVFVREGARVVVADVSGAEEDTAQQLGPNVLPFHCDVSKEDDVKNLIEFAVAQFGRLDALLNNAGVVGSSPITEMSMEDFDRIVNVNLRGVVLGMKYGILAMMESGGGSVINWSSIGGLGSMGPPAAVYGASKAGVIAATRDAAVELGPHGIRINAICPGFILTEGIGMPAIEKVPSIAEKPPLRRAGLSSEVAELASFLASDRASYITGATIAIDGGLTAKH